jgi:hypothetical protein
MAWLNGVPPMRSQKTITPSFLSADAGNDICQLLGELACLVLVERDNIELLLRASNHLDGAVETNGKVSVTSEHKSDHASPPLTGFFITPHRLEDFWFQQGTSLLRPSCFSVAGYYHVSTNATLQDLPHLVQRKLGYSLLHAVYG